MHEHALPAGEIGACDEIIKRQDDFSNSSGTASSSHCSLPIYESRSEIKWVFHVHCKVWYLCSFPPPHILNLDFSKNSPASDQHEYLWDCGSIMLAIVGNVSSEANISNISSDK